MRKEKFCYPFLIFFCPDAASWRATSYWRKHRIRSMPNRNFLCFLMKYMVQSHTNDLLTKKYTWKLERFPFSDVYVFKEYEAYGTNYFW